MMESPMLSGSCRCCASEGAYKDVKSSYHWMGEEEIYADMLKDCFDISLSPASDGQDEGGICEICITQLRNAANFKKQVLHTDEQFKNKLQSGYFKPEIVKVELPGEDGIESDDNNASVEEGYSGPEFEVPIKAEEIEESKPKKRAAKKGPTTRAKKAKTDAEDAETSTKRIGRRTRIIEIGKLPKSKIELKFVSKPMLRDLRVDPDTPPTEMLKNKLNLKNILLYSNANLIRCKDNQGYGCGFCPKKFQETINLKGHFLEEHNNDKLIKHITSKLFEHVIKLDISSLNCALCDKDLHMLEDLIHHLKNDHGKDMYTDLKNQILPFRFDTPEFRCAICSVEFLTFKLLQEHMNSHYRNYICEVCGAGFVAERLYSSHVRRHVNGVFKCDECNKTFGTEANKRGHMRRTHLGFSKRNKCKYCDERFTDYWNKVSHMVKEHGMEPVVLKCQACDRTFNNQRSLARHTKKDHLLERRHNCSECDMRFFGKSSLQKHMAKHTGLRQFRCDVCFKAYGRKTTLREHMRIHANDRRFACTHCGQAFVQKCSWRGHMRSKHGEKV